MFWLHLQKIIQNWRQTFWLKCQWVNLSVQGNNLREVIFCRRMKFCDNFVMWAKIFRNFNKKMHARLSKVSSYVSRLTFWGIFSKKFHFLSTFSENEQKAIQLLAEIFRHAFQKCIWSLQRNILRLFLKKVQLFHLFWTLSSKIYPTFAENLRQACQKCIIGVKGNILRKNNFFGKNTCFFWLLLDFQPFFFRKFDKSFSARLYKLHFADTGEESEQNFLSEKKHFFIDVLNFSNKKIGVLAKTRLQCCQNCILCVQGNALRFVLKKIHFFLSLSEYEQKAIKLLAEITRQACLNCNLDVGGIISRKNNFFGKKIYVPLHRFWKTGPIFSALWQKYSSTVVQTAFYLSIGGVWERLFIGESKFNFHFPKLNKKIILFVKKTAATSKLHSRCQEERFWGKTFFWKV